MKNVKIIEAKSKLKSLANEIRSLRSKRKEYDNGYIYELGQLQYEFRHRHIALCLLRGTSYQSIETPLHTSQPSSALLEKFMEEIAETLTKEELDGFHQETLCAGTLGLIQNTASRSILSRRGQALFGRWVLEKPASRTLESAS